MGNGGRGGGGIKNEGVLTITESTFSGNFALEVGGGGIWNRGDLTISNSTFFDNSAVSTGGGVRNFGTLSVTNSTFSGNRGGGGDEGGGIQNDGGILTVTHSTFSDNRGGHTGHGIVNGGGSLHLTNSLFTNNASEGADCFSSSTLATNVNNLIEDGSCGAALSADPHLAPLADNGGPTPTHALCTGFGEPHAACTGASPAIDAADNTVCASVGNLDQRGEPRPVDGDGDGEAVCDIGAYELQVAFFPFEGFLPPVDNPDTVNAAKAGQGIPVKFGLGGDRGLEIFQMGYPKAVQIGCDGDMPVDPIEETVTGSASDLSYDPTTDTYTYVWKTQKAWAGQCRRLALRLTDGSEHTALFQFK